MFELHDVELTLKLKDIDDRFKIITRLRSKILIWFKYNTSKIIGKAFDKDLYLNNQMEPIVEIYNPIQKYYNIELFNFTSFNNEINKLKVRKAELEQLKISEQVFTAILIKFNTKLVDSIIEEDYKFNNTHFGSLGKHINKKSKPSVDWSASNKAKEKLIAEGKIPAYKENRLKAEAEGIPYEGVNWLEYSSPYNFYFTWKYEYHHTIKFFNIKNYNFIPYRGETSPTMKLHKFRNTFTEEQLINQYNLSSYAN